MSVTNQEKPKNNTISTTLLIVLLAVLAVTAASLAWFSIADQTKLSQMKMDITGGKSLRFDLDGHEIFDDYVMTLSFEEIAENILKEQGIDMTQNSMEPVTTEDGIHFFYQNGKEAEKKDIIEFQLHFMSTADMQVHLTSENSKNGDDGTLVTSENPDTPLALRIAFLMDGQCFVYDPGMDGGSEKKSKMTVFGLYSAAQMKYNKQNMLFQLPEGVDVPVTVRIWLEGTDEACANAIKNSDFSIRLRFIGADENGDIFD